MKLEASARDKQHDEQDIILTLQTFPHILHRLKLKSLLAFFFSSFGARDAGSSEYSIAFASSRLIWANVIICSIASNPMPSIIGFSYNSSSFSSSFSTPRSSFVSSSSASISSIPLGAVVFEISHFGIVPGCCPSILPLSFLFSFSRSLFANFFSYSLSFTASSRNFGCTSSTNVASILNI